MGHSAELLKFHHADERLLEIGRLMRRWKCRRANDETCPCWTAHSQRDRNREGNESGPWVNVETESSYGGDPGKGAPGALILRGSKQRAVYHRGEEPAICVADVAGYCPPCRARERLLILRGHWRRARVGALNSLRHAVRRSPECAPVLAVPAAATSPRTIALEKFAAADAELRKTKTALADAAEVVEVEHADHVTCLNTVEGTYGSLRSVPRFLSTRQLAGICDACKAVHRAYWARHDAFRRRGARLRTVRTYFDIPWSEKAFRP